MSACPIAFYKGKDADPVLATKYLSPIIKMIASTTNLFTFPDNSAAVVEFINSSDLGMFLVSLVAIFLNI
jgi:hypothetical protein